MRHEHAPSRSWRPLASIVGLCVALILLMLLVGQLRSAVDPQIRAAQEAEQLRQQVINERLEPLDVAVAAGWRMLPLLLVAGVGAVALLVAYRRWAVPAMIQADKVIELTRAQSQRFPAALQSLSFHDSSRHEIAEAEEVEETPALLAPVPTFSELLSRGEIGAGRPLVLGYGASGEALRGGWRDLYSTLVSGQSGTGKSTTQRYFAGQAALQGSRFIVIDPHMDAGDDSLAATLEPLRALYLCEPADNERAILAAVKLARDIGEKRLHGQDKNREPILVWCDEATSLLAHSKIGPELAELLEIIAQQYRKVGIFASVSAQIVTASRTGGDSALRDSLASVICHKMKRSQARLILPLEDAQLAERLEPGHAILWRTSGASEAIAIPNTSAGDMRQVAGLLGASQPVMPRLRAAPAAAPAGSNDDLLRSLLEPHWSHIGAGSSALIRGGPLSAEAERISRLFDEGADISAIVREVYDVSSANGSQYQKRSAEVQRLLREARRRAP
jgi:hypothetical protein